LTNITIPERHQFGNYAFDGCIGLTNITILTASPASDLVHAPGCARLTNITIPASVTKISEIMRSMAHQHDSYNCGPKTTWFTAVRTEFCST